MPLKFRVGDVNGNSIGTPGTIASFRIIDIITGTVSTSVDLPPSSTTPDTSFRFDPTAQQWIFNLNTSGLSVAKTRPFKPTGKGKMSARTAPAVSSNPRNSM